jgi:hypothetical protein
MPPAHQPQNADSARDFVKQSSLYQEFLAEREEILKHKWLESERLGYDIGFERALLDWIRKHRDSWRAARRSQTSGTVTPSPFASANRKETAKSASSQASAQASKA